MKDPTSDTGYRQGAEISKRLARSHKLDQDERNRERGNMLSAILSAGSDDRQSLPVRPTDVNEAFIPTATDPTPRSPRRRSPEPVRISFYFLLFSL